LIETTKLRTFVDRVQQFL